MNPTLMAILARMQKTAQAGHVKTALPGGKAFDLLRRAFTRPAVARPPVAPRPTPPPRLPVAPKPAPVAQPYVPPTPREFSPRRLAQTTAAISGVGLGGAATVGHLQEQGNNTTEGHFYNPWSWGNYDLTDEQRQNKQVDIFRHNNEQFNSQADAMKTDFNSQIQQAIARGDHGQAQALQQEMMQKLQSGDFGGSMWRMGGLNPFAQQRASQYRGRAVGAQEGLQGAYNHAMGQVGPQPGDAERLQQMQERMQQGNVLPYEAQQLQQQIEELQKKMQAQPGTESEYAKAVRARMERSGARFSPFGPPKPAAPAAGPAAHLGKRGPGYVQGYGLNPYDMRAQNPWESLVEHGPMRYSDQQGR